MYLTIKHFACLIAFYLSFQTTFGQNTTQKVKEYYSNGNIKLKGKLKNNDTIGYWFFYDERGFIIKKEKWHKGKLSWAIIYNEKQKPKEYIDKNGTIKKLKGCGC